MKSHLTTEVLTQGHSSQDCDTVSPQVSDCESPRWASGLALESRMPPSSGSRAENASLPDSRFAQRAAEVEPTS
ncbi:hypothetical protein EYF80_034585 [Liparis tanakae]|uniref:Uncharacterized protein n=1 Tax=Liparis tanakae TaxID=230148 RepID=A0A4Z2GR92_9TELE|nr:hypothetical protein EYF80_034585 [Liparis tanakae]